MLPRGPGMRDWALLVISVVFVIIGILMLRDRPREALLPLTFFGVCAAVFGYNIARKLRRRRFVATTVSVVGGVELRGSSSRMLILAAMIGAPGIAFLFAPDLPLLVRVCVAVMLGASAMVFWWVLSGRIARRFLRFDPLGLTIAGTKVEYVVPWDEMTDITEFEMHDNAVVGFNVVRPELLLVTPELERARVLKAMAKNRAYLDLDVAIMALHYALPAETLCAALRNYSGNPAARAELVRKPALGTQ